MEYNVLTLIPRYSEFPLMFHNPDEKDFSPMNIPSTKKLERFIGITGFPIRVARLQLAFFLK